MRSRGSSEIFANHFYFATWFRHTGDKRPPISCGAGIAARRGGTRLGAEIKEDRMRGKALTGVLAVGLLAVGVGGTTVAQTAGERPGDRPGRYSMSPADGGGFVRLDTETGAMALCQRRDTDWTCREMAEPSRGLGDEVERLRAENQRLKGEIRQMEDIIVGDKRGGGERRAERPGSTFQLPSEQDVDQAMTYVQRMMRKFREKLKEFESDTGGAGKGTPL